MKSVRFHASVAVLMIGSLGLAKASAPVYEGFNYSSGQSITTLTSTATGLGNWTSISGNITGTTVAGGLTFGSLTTSGGALDITDTASNAWTFLDASIGANIANGSTLYSSYLFQYNGVGGDGSSNNFGISVGNTTGGTTAVNRTFSLLEGSYNSNPTSGRIGYADGSVNGNPIPFATLNYTESINSGNTYLFIGEWTNLGGASTGTGWVLNLADFNAISGAPITDALLTANSIAHATVAGTAGSFGTAQFAKIGDFMAAPVNYKVDEIRYSSNLADVVPVSVPEPSSYAIFIGAGCLGLVALRRRKLVLAR